MIQIYRPLYPVLPLYLGYFLRKELPGYPHLHIIILMNAKSSHILTWNTILMVMLKNSHISSGLLHFDTYFQPPEACCIWTGFIISGNAVDKGWSIKKLGKKLDRPCHINIYDLLSLSLNMLTFWWNYEYRNVECCPNCIVHEC